MTNQKRDKDGKFANGPVSPPPSPEWAKKVLAEAEALDNPADRYNHMVEALRNLTTPPTEPSPAGNAELSEGSENVALSAFRCSPPCTRSYGYTVDSHNNKKCQECGYSILTDDDLASTAAEPDPAPVTNAQHHQANKLAVRYGEHDPDRELVHFGWDGNSNSIYLYRDQRDLPDWQRTHIIKHRVETPVVEETKETVETCDWCDKPAAMYAPAYGGGTRLVCVGHSKATLSRADGTAPCTVCHQPSVLIVQRPNGSWSACETHIGGLQADAARRFNRQAEIDAFNVAREAMIRGSINRGFASLENAMTPPRPVTSDELDARETAMATPRRTSGPRQGNAERVPDGTWQEGDVVKVHSDADGQPVTFEYKVVTRKPRTVIIRMIRMNGTLGEEQTFRVKTYEDGREYIALNRYQSAFAPTAPKA